MQKEKELLRNVPKLDSFFASSRPSTSTGDWSDETDGHQPASVSDCDELSQIPQNLISENPAAVIGEDSGEHPESHANTCFAIPSFPSVSDNPAKWILDDATLRTKLRETKYGCRFIFFEAPVRRYNQVSIPFTL